MDPGIPGERATGPEMLSVRELKANRLTPSDHICKHPLDDQFYRDRSVDWSRVITPFLSCSNWAGYGLHPRGNFEAFTQAASTQKWLECHPGKHEEWFYLEQSMSLQRRFLDHFLKGIDNGWDSELPVQGRSALRPGLVPLLPHYSSSLFSEWSMPCAFEKSIWRYLIA